MKKITFLLLVLFILCTTPVFGQIILYKIPTKDIYPTIYVVQQVKRVSSLQEMQENIATDSRQIIYGYITKNDNPSLDVLQNKVSKLPKISYKKISDAMYDVSVKNITGNFILVFNQQYHPGWVLLASDSRILCQNFTPFSRFNTYACSDRESNFPFFQNLEGVFTAKEVGQHLRINAFSNAWYIQQTGSSMNFILYFRMQEYLQFGIVISIGTIVLCCLYLLYRLIKK